MLQANKVCTRFVPISTWLYHPSFSESRVAESKERHSHKGCIAQFTTATSFIPLRVYIVHRYLASGYQMFSGTIEDTGILATASALTHASGAPTDPVVTVVDGVSARRSGGRRPSSFPERSTQEKLLAVECATGRSRSAGGLRDAGALHSGGDTGAIREYVARASCALCKNDAVGESVATSTIPSHR
jgi:hypothetical protein